MRALLALNLLFFFCYKDIVQERGLWSLNNLIMNCLMELLKKQTIWYRPIKILFPSIQVLTEFNIYMSLFKVIKEMKLFELAFLCFILMSWTCDNFHYIILQLSTIIEYMLLTQVKCIFTISHSFTQIYMKGIQI